MSINAVAKGHLLALAFRIRVVKHITASIVLLFGRNPNWCCPSKPCSSTMLDILDAILTVIKRKILDGTVMGLYCFGCKESPPYNQGIKNENILPYLVY